LSNDLGENYKLNKTKALSPPIRHQNNGKLFQKRKNKLIRLAFSLGKRDAAQLLTELANQRIRPLCHLS
jgi:hypothetical protein